MRRTGNLFNRGKLNEKFTPQTAIRERAKLAPKPRKHELLIIFLIALTLNLAVALSLQFRLAHRGSGCTNHYSQWFPDPLHRSVDTSGWSPW